jgi:RNA polymerase sigma-70 factor (ECF subfamily)
MNEEMSQSEELAVLWTQSQRSVGAFIASLVPNFQDADDILQNVAVITVKKFDRFDKEKSFVSWAIGIARNEILKYYAEKKKNHAIPDIEAIEQIADIYESERASNDLYDRTIKVALASCIGRLRDKWKHMLELYYLREQSSARIAQQLAMTRSNFFTSLHRIRFALKECVTKEMRRS